METEQTETGKAATTTSVFVRFTSAGLHYWPNPTDGRWYLAAPHRHLFYIEVEAFVAHDDRAIEFHDMLDDARRAWEQAGAEINGLGLNFGPRSCEMLAHQLGRTLRSYHYPIVRVTVSEDNEVGATVRWH